MLLWSGTRRTVLGATQDPPLHPRDRRRGLNKAARTPSVISNNFLGAFCSLPRPPFPGGCGGFQRPGSPLATAPSRLLGTRVGGETPRGPQCSVSQLLCTQEGGQGATVWWGGLGVGAQGGASRTHYPCPQSLLRPQSFCSPRVQRTQDTSGCGRPSHPVPPAPTPPPKFRELRCLPSPHRVSSRVPVICVLCSFPGQARWTSALGESPIFTNLGSRSFPGAARSLKGAPGADTQRAPSSLGLGAQPTYMVAGSRPDSGLAADAEGAAERAAPGRSHPSSGQLGTRAGRTTEGAAPPARSARRVHRARASPRACSSRCRRPAVAAQPASEPAPPSAAHPRVSSPRLQDEARPGTAAA